LGKKPWYKIGEPFCWEKSERKKFLQSRTMYLT
jgi:hypothetical protein